MRLLFLLFTIFLFNSFSFGQTATTYTSRIGSKFFPGHSDIVITIENDSVRYELFNHWYVSAYAELRQMKISLDSLESLNTNNDSIQIKIYDNKIQLIDKKYGINKKIKDKKLCASPERMRKISFAYKISSNNENVRHYELYTNDDLNLSETEFEKKVIENMEKIEK
ncbi:hypothetical protein LJC53_06940 [Bacteroidales bacterium OttesenSCG-928-C03]|nr:hypothetical protein [Bacteroidales bacterium OttesenSCG-928-C03]